MDISMYARFSSIIGTNGSDAACATAKRLGFTSVEHLEIHAKGYEPVLRSSDDAYALKESIVRHGLSISCYSVAINLWESGMTPDTVTEAERSLMRHAELARAVGSPFLHHTLMLGVKKDALSLSDAVSLIAPVAIRVARYARSLGITCLYENQGMFFNGVDGFRAFYSAVKSECPEVGVCGDIGNVLFVDESPTDFFEAFASEMRHVHIKDYVKAERRGAGRCWDESKGGIWLKDSVIGHGCIEIKSCLEALKKVGYRGAFSLENGHEEDFEYGVREGIDLLKGSFS